MGKKRQGRDRSTGSAPSSEGGYWFGEKDADGAVAFVEWHLRHWEGRWAGQPFALLDWQRKIIRDLFGWKRPDGTRKYRYAYIEVPKGNGKSPMLGAIGLLLLLWDGEPGAQVYGVAGDKEQAAIVYRDAANMIAQSDDLAAATVTFKNRIVYPATRSWYEVLSSDAPTKHGLRPHGILFDELHVQKGRDLFDTLRYAMGKRAQPLFAMITTAGIFDEDSLGWTEHCYAKAVIDGEIEDPSYYAVIYSAEEGEDWTSPVVWEKANPSYGVTVRQDELQEFCSRAQQDPSAQPAFRQLRLNVWGASSQGGLDMHAWRCTAASPQIEPGSRVWAGLDLSSKLDLTALTLVAPHYSEDGKVDAISLLPFFWVPEGTPVVGLRERMRRDVFDYPRYVREGLITATPGHIVDQASIRTKLRELRAVYRIVEVAFDAWNASQMAVWLGQDGFEVCEIPQNPKHLSEPSKTLKGMVANMRVYHGRHPVLTWNAGNVVFKRDDKDNWQPAKDRKGRKRIDGVGAALNAMSRILVSPGESVYATRGALFV